jgi:hypothetical protein
VGDAEQLACGRAGYFAPDNDAVTRHERFLDVKLHVWDGRGEVPDHLD